MPTLVPLHRVCLFAYLSEFELSFLSYQFPSSDCHATNVRHKTYYKTADFQNETKQPIFRTRQNSRCPKRDKTADFQHGTK